MKTKFYFGLLALVLVIGCSNEEVSTVNPVENQLNVAKRTASPIAQWTKPAIWDNNTMLQTALWFPPPVDATMKGYYSFAQFPDYDFSPYYLNGDTEYNPANYDVMTHFGYISPEDVKGAFVEFTFPQIKYFLPHMNNKNQQRIYNVNNLDNQTVITCTTDLVKGMNPMFCFLLKVDCGKVKSGYANIWTDMKVNGVSVKGSIKNKVFDCN